MDYERRQVYGAPRPTSTCPPTRKALDARIAELLADHPANDELKAAVVHGGRPRRKSVAVLQTGETHPDHRRRPAPRDLGLAVATPRPAIRRGAVIRASSGRQIKTAGTITQLPEVEGAFVAMDPQSGEVHAMVGGFDYAKNKFNHVTQAWRQPGSSFKPFIYSSALEVASRPPRS